MPKALRWFLLLVGLLLSSVLAWAQAPAEGKAPAQSPAAAPGAATLPAPAPAKAPSPNQPKAQGRPEVELVPGPATMPVTGLYTLAFRLRGAALTSYTPFPELEGFKKSGKTSTTTTRIVQGRSFSELTITQRYMPYGEGEKVIPPFQMTVNGVTVRSKGGTVRVGPAPSPAPAPTPAPPGGQEPLQAIGDLDQLFGKPKPALYQDVPDHAFLAVEADRKSVFVGEGVSVGLYFFLQPADQQLLAFYDFNDQLPRLLRQLHQPTAWEVPGPEAKATPDTVRREGQLYLRYRLAEATYYPLNTQPLRFPPLALTMTKFKVLKKPEPGVDGRLAGYKTYMSPGVGVAVRPLPPHPLRDQVAVGTYELQEAISRTSFRVGQSFTYAFGVEGRGNLAAVMAPLPLARPGLEVYGPELREALVPGGGRKLFRYRLVARQAGELPLDSVFQLIVFNPATARYDTLRPGVRPRVQGAAPTVVKPARPEDDPFYGPALAAADATLQPFDVYGQVRRYASWVLGGLFVLGLAGWVTSKRISREQ